MRMMKNFWILLLSQHIICTNIHTVDNIPLESINLTLISKNHEATNVNLKPVNTFLANKNIPIWIARGMLLGRINSTKVMMKIGAFTTYQDPETSSAVVYFHKQRKFTGTIDHRYFIKHLSIKDRHHEEIQVNKSGPIFSRAKSGHWFGKKSMRNIDEIFFIQRFDKSEKITPSESKPKVTLLNERPNIYYVETMVFINYDIMNELKEESNDEYTSIASYLLTLFNSVDMLYSKIDSPKIKFNIAGIIVGPNRESFLGLNKCYHQANGSTLKVPRKEMLVYLNAYCTIDFINGYLTKFWKLIPRESYDIAIFLSRYGLYVNEYNVKTNEVELIKLGGSSRRYPTSGYHEYRVNDIKYVPSISVTDLGNFSSFPIIAHETAHLFGVKHDSSPVQKNGLCTAKIMKSTIGYCKFCLSWSEVSRNFMHIFFRSPDRCPFINEPRSLRNPGPSQIWTVNQQCQCYGHEPVHKMRADNITNTWIDSDLFCRTHLQCETSNGTSVKAPIPMDGTPCNKNKVCWNKECRKIELLNATTQLNFI